MLTGGGCGPTNRWLEPPVWRKYEGVRQGRANDRSRPVTILNRPFYFVVVLWGQRFRDYFLDYCLPSLLSPGNLPSLSTSTPSTLVIATQQEDWVAMKATAVFQEMERHVTPVMAEIPPYSPGKSVYEHMGLGHKIALGMAHRAKAYTMALTPDCMLSDGSISRLQDLARDGVELVLAPALRFGEEPFLKHLDTMGVLPAGRQRGGAEPLVATGRQLVSAAVNSLHPETLSYEWATPYFVPVAPAAWWRVPGEDGLILHSLSWAVLLLDYAVLIEHDTSTLDSWNLDGDYLHKNLRRLTNIHIVCDSDEMFLASWGPMNQNRCEPSPLFKIPVAGKMMRATQFRDSFYGPLFDAFKRRIFFYPVRWHARPLNAEWERVEQEAARTLGHWLRPQETIGLRIVLLPLRLLFFISECWTNRAAMLRRLGQLLRGDPGVREWVAWRLRAMACRLLGIKFNAPRPTPPPR
jgi:hypothetical protein